MQQRLSYDIALKELKLKLLKMGNDVQEALRESIVALKTLDIVKGRQIVTNDVHINHQEHEIEDMCIRLIATQQPVATDLRKIVAGLRIASDLERMADLAVDISKSAIRLEGQAMRFPLIDIPRMGQMIDVMISDALNAYVDNNIELARKLAVMDDEVDHLYRGLVEHLVTSDYDEEESRAQAITMAFCGRYLERIGDHATNIGESVIYIVSGERSDLN